MNTEITSEDLKTLYYRAIEYFIAKEGENSDPDTVSIDEDGNFAVQNTPSPMQTTELVMAIEKLFK